MLDHYTTGLRTFNKTTEVPRNNFNVASRALLFALGFSYAIAFLTDRVVVLAEPKRVHDGVFALSVACRAEHSVRIVVSVVAVAVSAELCLLAAFQQLFCLRKAFLHSLQDGFPPEILPQPLHNGSNHDWKNHQSIPDNHHVVSFTLHFAPAYGFAQRRPG